MPPSTAEPTVIMYGIPNCSTVKSARAWLDAHGIDYAFHDFKKAGVDAALVDSWLAHREMDLLINRKGTTWRALSDAQKAGAADRKQATALMIAQPSVIKRPVLAVGGGVHVGFTEAAYARIFQGAAS